MNYLTPVMAAAIAYATHDDLERLMPEARGKSVFSLRAMADDTVELMLYGPIGDFFWEGISARDIVDQISGITAGAVKG